MTSYEMYVLCVLVGGFLPCAIQIRRSGNKRTVEVRALFWCVKVTDCQWSIHIFLLQRLRKAVWEIFKHFLQPPDEFE